ncbi:endoglucanase [Striga asiatica]|uniref:Endoglucanase n=1 Tax=Striga asiatica TaxID=4170 RepID=A0A5A7P4I3_STRAF|nr:endoglucanase [Striga asiatica]
MCHPISHLLWIMNMVALTLFFLLSSSFAYHGNVEAKRAHDYAEALSKSVMFFQGQRSGSLEVVDQEIVWRGDSGLSDGQSDHVDLTGGYYDAGDNVKFNLPMAFTTTMLSWSAIEYGKKLGPQLASTRAAIRLYVGVGDANKDHKCWERPEDMDTDRTAYYVSAKKPGSDVAGETAAALASASIVFRKSDPEYSKLLLRTATSVMKFAVKHRGRYNESVGYFVGKFYPSAGFEDELAWGAAWLHRATDESRYIELIPPFGFEELPDIFNWNNKHYGVYVLLARLNLVNKDDKFATFSKKVESFVCNLTTSTTLYTPGGLIYKRYWSNLQHVTAITFLLTTYAKYMATSSHEYMFDCGGLITLTPSHLRNLSKTQVDYILGDNPSKMSYMVGYGSRFPKKIHHRGSSLPSIHVRKEHIQCRQGFKYFNSTIDNPNMLTGAIVGGPDKNDIFHDKRDDYVHTEPTTYTNAAIVGTLAYFAAV